MVVIIKTKPWTGEAVRFKEDASNWKEVEAFGTIHEGLGVAEYYVSRSDESERDKYSAETLFQVFDILHRSWVTFFPGQWIIKGLKGEFYPCDNEVFEAKYEVVL